MGQSLTRGGVGGKNGIKSVEKVMVRSLTQREAMFHGHRDRLHELMPGSGSKHSPCQTEAGKDTGHGNRAGVDQGGDAAPVIHGDLTHVGLAGEPDPRI